MLRSIRLVFFKDGAFLCLTAINKILDCTLSTCLPVSIPSVQLCPSIHPSTSLNVCQSLTPLTYSFTLSIHSSTSLNIHLSLTSLIYLFTLYIHSSISLNIHLSFTTFTHFFTSPICHPPHPQPTTPLPPFTAHSSTQLITLPSSSLSI